MTNHQIDFDGDGHIILRISWRPVVKVLVILALAVGAGYLPISGLTEPSRICLMIFVGAAGLWVTEAIQPFATAIMVIVLSVYLLGAPNGPLGFERTGLTTSYQLFLNPIASPVLVLFFGGFILAAAATKHGLDVRLARAFIKPFGSRPSMVLLGIILTTGVFSMFMSNTATTAMMIAILAPLFTRFEGRDPFKKAIVLAVPFAANVGGMGTIIGTPPNAVAASVLQQLGHGVSFTRWMVIGVPIVIVLLFVLWQMLLHIFKPKTDHLEVLFPEGIELTWDLVVVVLTFTATVVLWMLEPLLKIPSAVVAMLPVMVFTTLGIINREDLKRIEWHVLALIAGGLTLGVAMKASGLSDLLVKSVSDIPVGPVFLLIVLAVFTVFLSNFMSNTAAANLLIPIVTAIGVFSPVLAGVTIALACSLAMSLPISTPPNALAFATQAIETRDMARYGTLFSLVGLLITLGVLAVAIRVFDVL